MIKASRDIGVQFDGFAPEVIEDYCNITAAVYEALVAAMGIDNAKMLIVSSVRKALDHVDLNGTENSDGT